MLAIIFSSVVVVELVAPSLLSGVLEEEEASLDTSPADELTFEFKFEFSFFSLPQAAKPVVNIAIASKNAIFFFII